MRIRLTLKPPFGTSDLELTGCAVYRIFHRVSDIYGAIKNHIAVCGGEDEPGGSLICRGLGNDDVHVGESPRHCRGTEGADKNVDPRVLPPLFNSNCNGLIRRNRARVIGT